MPGRNGTGPLGEGAMTGRGVGFCNDFSATDSINKIGSFGQYGCRGRFRRQFYASTNTPHNYDFDEKAYLLNQEAILDNQLKKVKERLVKYKEEA